MNEQSQKIISEKEAEFIKSRDHPLLETIPDTLLGGGLGGLTHYHLKRMAANKEADEILSQLETDDYSSFMAKESINRMTLIAVIRKVAAKDTVNAEAMFEKGRKEALEEEADKRKESAKNAGKDRWKNDLINAKKKELFKEFYKHNRGKFRTQEAFIKDVCRYIDEHFYDKMNKEGEIISLSRDTAQRWMKKLDAGEQI